MADRDERRTRETSPGDASFPVAPPVHALPEWYPGLLQAVSERVAAGRGRAIAAANRELVAIYWAIGRDILARQSEQGWGARVIDRLSADLQERFLTRGSSHRAA